MLEFFFIFKLPQEIFCKNRESLNIKLPRFITYNKTTTCVLQMIRNRNKYYKWGINLILTFGEYRINLKMQIDKVL